MHVGPLPDLVCLIIPTPSGDLIHSLIRASSTQRRCATHAAVASAGPLDALRRSRPRSPGASKARLDDSLSGRTPPGCAAHLVRGAPPLGCHHRAGPGAQSVAVIRTRARGDAAQPSNGAPQPIGVRTGTADSLPPDRPPHEKSRVGRFHLTPPENCLSSDLRIEVDVPPRAFAEAESGTANMCGQA
jgi:hypothetical protein